MAETTYTPRLRAWLSDLKETFEVKMVTEMREYSGTWLSPETYVGMKITIRFTGRPPFVPELMLTGGGSLYGEINAVPYGGNGYIDGRVFIGHVPLPRDETWFAGCTREFHEPLRWLVYADWLEEKGDRDVPLVRAFADSLTAWLKGETK